MDTAHRTGVHSDHGDRDRVSDHSADAEPRRLNGISDNALIRRLERLRGGERRIVVGILHHLREVERRGVYLRRGYCSLFEFCTEHLKYSRSAAGRRIAAARSLGRFPEVESDLLSGRITLYSLAIASRILTDANRREVFARIRNRSSRDVEALVAGCRPREMFRDRIRPLSILVPEPHGGGIGGSEEGRGDRCGDGVHCGEGTHAGEGERSGERSRCDDGVHCGEGDLRAGAGGPLAGAPGVIPNAHGVPPASAIPPAHGVPSAPGAGSGQDPQAMPEQSVGAVGANRSGAHPWFGVTSSGRMKVLRRFRLEFAVDPRFIDKLEKTKALVSTRFPAGIGLEVLFELLMDEFIDRHSPHARANRRKQRQARAISRTNGNPDDRPASNGSHPESGKSTGARETPRPARATSGRQPPDPPCDGGRPADSPRGVPARIRDEVYLRDGGRCTFRGPDGRRCSATLNLQIDHIVPRALGGGNEPGNLRLLCGKHNRLEAERVLGRPLPRRRPGRTGEDPDPDG